MMFASEYAILMASAMNTTAKYCVCVIDLRRARQRGGENAPPWQNKSMWVFYIELVTDFLKLTTYLLFFLLIVAFYGLPLNIIRDVYLTGRSFVTRLRALVRYRAATRNMDERYPDASEEEMSAMTDRTCIICREEMFVHGVSGNQDGDSGSNPAQQNSDGPNTTPKKLPCGHIFHFYCLRSWLERQQSCPTCRRSVLENTQEQQRPAGAQETSLKHLVMLMTNPRQMQWLRGGYLGKHQALSFNITSSTRGRHLHGMHLRLRLRLLLSLCLAFLGSLTSMDDGASGVWIPDGLAASLRAPRNNPRPSRVTHG